MSLDSVVTKELKRVLDSYISDDVEVDKILERPRNSSFGDFSFPTFSFAKIKRKSPK